MRGGEGLESALAKTFIRELGREGRETSCVWGDHVIQMEAILRTLVSRTLWRQGYPWQGSALPAGDCVRDGIISDCHRSSFG